VGVDRKGGNSIAPDESLLELAELSATAGGLVVGEGIQKLETPVAATFIGSGKAKAFAAECKEREVDTVIFDEELSPAQSRNLEKIFDCKILDRTSLILDIFAQRARTREGKFQVELAQLQHLLPRLTRYWSHLSRQKGGIGMRGDGETQLETDRRRIQVRIEKITMELDTVRKQRDTQRQGRQRSLWPLASIVGYTNAGKSTMLNRLTGASVLVEDKLFATLDPTTRRLRLPSNQNVLLSDTVGFIRKLPHRLVEAFKATLEEVVCADLLIHVVDISHPQALEQIEAVNSVLEELNAEGKPTLMVFNKVDRLSRQSAPHWHHDRYPNAVSISATQGIGIEALLVELGNSLRPCRDFLTLKVPHEDSAVMARLHSVGEVVECDYDGPVASIKARVPPHFRSEFQRFIEG
jgi:GTPase